LQDYSDLVKTPLIRHNVSLKHLRSFLAVADAGSFTVASSRLFVTQSALTATIQQFEDAVGMRMFDRTTRRVALTDAAKHFKLEAEQAVLAFDAAVGHLMADAEGRQGHVRIGAAASVIRQFLAPAISKFRAIHPQVTISLRDLAAQHIERLVEEGEVDFAIESKHQGFDGLDYTPLVTDRYGVVCHPDSPMARDGHPICWSDLGAAEYVSFSADTGIGQFLRGYADQWPILGGTHDEVASITSMIAVLGMGNRYSIVPVMALSGRDLPGLVFRELHDPPLSREICLITRKGRSLPPGARRLLYLLLSEIQMNDLPVGVTLVPKKSGRGFSDSRFSSL
jgi:DNA-binding transcriptional LysR family regulator